MIADQAITAPYAWARCEADGVPACDYSLPASPYGYCDDYWRWELAHLALNRKHSRELAAMPARDRDSVAWVRHRTESGDLSRRGDAIEDAANTYATEPSGEAVSS